MRLLSLALALLLAASAASAKAPSTLASTGSSGNGNGTNGAAGVYGSSGSSSGAYSGSSAPQRPSVNASWHDLDVPAKAQCTVRTQAIFSRVYLIILRCKVLCQTLSSM